MMKKKPEQIYPGKFPRLRSSEQQGKYFTKKLKQQEKKKVKLADRK